MSVSTALRHARRRRGLRLRDVGREIYLSPKTVSAIETGRRRLPHDLAPRLARALEDPELVAALAAEVTGGMAAPWLNGERVDLHRASVRIKAIEELSEAIEALAKCEPIVNCRCADDLDEPGRRLVAEAVHHSVEAETAARTVVGVLCQTYGLSLAQVYREHILELQAKGYVRREATRDARKAS